MMKKITHFIFLFFVSTTTFAWQWRDLWQTPDQQGAALLHAGHAKEAAEHFNQTDWQAVALYQANNYNEALKKFSKGQTSDHQYNAGNAAAQLGKYQEAMTLYDKAIALNTNNTDAITNREIVKKLMEQEKQKNSAKNDKKDKKSPAADEKSAEANSNEKNAENQPTQQKPSKASAENQENNLNHASDPPEKNQNISTNSGTNSQDENKNQLLRRLTDDPGGLLRQKFLRDYYRRHAVALNQDQGDQ